jgi:hypothetical protein
MRNNSFINLFINYVFKQFEKISKIEINQALIFVIFAIGNNNLSFYN